MELADIEYTPFKGDKSYRFVVSRIKRSDHQIDVFQEVLILIGQFLPMIISGATKKLHTQRVSSEKTFDLMNNDFG